ncbi:MAG: class I SAM-dependent methyltransferase [Pseudomonadota bacterium]|nr:class I SAM-dependent methyltransferase [Pseudomonadota bacterium]
MSPADLAADARILWRLLRGQPRSGSHAERLEGFYAPQAARYDAFRARLLHGRGDLLAALEIPAGARVVELGCGTGSNLEALGKTRPLDTLASVHLIDLCPALLAVARQRTARYANVAVIEADATTWQPQQPVDRVFLSYALTMMPDWRAVLTNAWTMLAPGGRLGIVDFHLPEAGNRFANRLGNRFWQRWFAHDGVHLSGQHLPALQSLSVNPYLQERRAPVPYLPGLRAPYYLFVGAKPALRCTEATTA